MEYNKGDVLNGLKLIENLGMRFAKAPSTNKYQYGLWECSCGKTKRHSMSDVSRRNSNKCTCTHYAYGDHKAGSIHGPHDIQLLKDLGIILPVPNSNKRRRMGIFSCRCGKEFTTMFVSILSGRTTSCGCVASNKYSIGTVYGSGIKLLEDYGQQYYSDKSKVKSRYGRFLCHCGKEFRTIIGHISRGSTLSCGCATSKTHGLSRTKSYGMYMSMRKRCYVVNNIGYPNYGGRGITVCKGWMDDIYKFLRWTKLELDRMGCTEDDLGKGKGKLSLDRIDVDGNYEPSNCRLATPNTQARNTQKISKVNVSGYRGVKRKGSSFGSDIGIKGNHIVLSTSSTKWAAAQAYDQYVKDNNLEHTTNDLATPETIWCIGLNSLSHLDYSSKLDYLISGLLTRVINDSNTKHIVKCLEGTYIGELDIDLIETEIERLVSDHTFTYAVVEQCLRGSTIINLHG